MNHRDVRRASHILPMALLVAGVFGKHCYCQTEAVQPLENRQILVNSILTSLQNVRLPRAGRGSAVVIWDTAANEAGDRPRLIDFTFKGQKSRSDVFEFVAGEKGPWLYSHAVTDRFDFRVNAGGVRLSYHPKHNRLGEDFHPAAFLSLPGMQPIEEELRRCLKPEVEFSAHLLDGGIVQIGYRWYEIAAGRFSFDISREFLPVVIARDGGAYWPSQKSSRWTINLAWTRYGSGWYPTSAERLGYSVDAAGVPRRERLTITQFDPQAEVSDEEFTMEALGAREGMTVVDADTGFSHLYSPPVGTVWEWEEPPETAPPTPNREKQGSFSDEAVLATNAGRQREAPTEPLPQPSDTAHAAGADRLAAHPPRVVRIHTLLGLFLLLGMFVAVEYVQAHARARNRRQREL